MNRLTGLPGAPGTAMAPAFVLSSPSNPHEGVEEHRSGDADAEHQRLDEARRITSEQIQQLSDHVRTTAGGDEAEIFEVHASFLEDPDLLGSVRAAIDAGRSAEQAVIDGFGTFRDLLAGSANEYLAARVADLDDVRDRLVAALLGRSVQIETPVTRCVVVAHELTPSQTAALPLQHVAGIATESGSATSHAAILARSLGIPAVLGVDGLLSAVSEGVLLAVDGSDGSVSIAPDESEQERIRRTIAHETERRSQLSELRELPGRTADGHTVELAANIGSTTDLPAAVEMGAAGSGLVRTELLFLEATQAPGVDDQADYYRTVLDAFPDQRVVFRTLDIGADKPLPFVQRPEEDNPALGLRGIRLGLVRSDLLRDQVRALLKALTTARPRTGPMGLMFPMISVVSELVAARSVVEEIRRTEFPAIEPHELELGTMVEIPSAALEAGRLAAECDFLSIGTNDLLQYLFAADRLNSDVADVQNVCHPAVLRLLSRVVADGHAQGAWVGVCGEAAADPVVAATLVGLGIDELSMNARSIPEVKEAMRHVELETCRSAAHRAMEASDPRMSRELLEVAFR